MHLLKTEPLQHRELLFSSVAVHIRETVEIIASRLLLFSMLKLVQGLKTNKEGLQRYKLDWTEASCTQVTKICIA